MKKLLASFSHAFHNIRSHFFHTLLSVLGIVIGVASLVSILSLIDGMEQYAMAQIAKTTSLNAISIVANPYRTTNGVRVRKDSFSIISYEDYSDLKNTLTKPSSLHYIASFAGTGKSDNKDITALFYALGTPARADVKVIAGTPLKQDDIIAKKNIAAINLMFLKALDSTLKAGDAIGKKISIKNKELIISSVFDDGGDQARVGFPLTLLSDQELHSDPPSVVVEATVIQDVKDLESQINAWIGKRFPNKSDFNVFTNSMRVEQATQGFLLFRVIMGLIVGISVVVGGIGIMNVLLISITERTVEIGIRKAVGANRRDLIMQFLAESITVSVFGSVMGLIFGVLGTMAAVPIVSAVTKIPFYANYTLNTMLVVGVLAVLLGIIFGTYPALRASRLDPVEAIRHD
jgi:putative ABC transport system permease protein